MSNVHSAHGQNVFAENESCHCNPCEELRRAVRMMVHSYSTFPTEWLTRLSNHEIATPMWGTLFLLNDSYDVSQISELLTPIDSEGNDDRERLKDSGWQSVGNTGIFAIEFEDQLIMGIDGAGYCFYESHWSKLYSELGFRWHG